MGFVSKTEIFDNFSVLTKNELEISWFDLQHAGISSKIYEEVTQRGIAFIKNVTSEQDLIKISEWFGQVFSPRNGSSAGVANIHPDQKLHGKGYTHDALLFHTDRSGMEHPPKFLITTVKKQGEKGGSSTFVNGRRLQSQILSEDPKLYQMLRDPEMTRIRQEDGSFQCRPIFYGDDKIRCRFDNEIAFTHGLAEQLPVLMNHLTRLQISVNFQEGEGYILDNGWWLHGRDSFSGDRQVLRLLVNEAITDNQPTDKLILFDIDGTLLDSQAVSVGAFFKCMTKILGKPISLENCSSINLHGQTDLNLITEIAQLHTESQNPVKVKQLCQTFLNHHPTFMEREIEDNPIKIQPCEGVLELTKNIQTMLQICCNSNHINFGILTGNSQPNALAKIKAAGINPEIFDMSVSVFGDKYRKRNDMLPGLLQNRNVGFNFSPETTLIVGDTPLDIECAQVNKAKVLAVATGSYNLSTLASLQPDFCLPNLADVKKVLKIFKEF